MAVVHRTKCEICDHARALNARGWCEECEAEFAEWKARLPEKCVEACETPLACRIVKRCLAKFPQETGMPVCIMPADRST